MLSQAERKQARNRRPRLLQMMHDYCSVKGRCRRCLSRWRNGGRMLRDYARELSETPKASAFWRVAPTVRLSALAIFGAGVLARAIVLRSFTSLFVHSRRFAFLAMVPLSVRFKEHYAHKQCRCNTNSADVRLKHSACC